MRRVSAARLAYDSPPEYIHLVDRPHETRNVARVCSPFTVESETPHAYIPLANASPDDTSIADTLRATASGALVDRVVETLLQTGIGNVQTGGRVDVLDIEPWPGTLGSLITHKARCIMTGSSEQEAAVMIAAEDVTVTPAMLSSAAADAARQVHGTELLISAAFAFDPATTDDTRIGRVQVIRTMMNRDLQIGELAPDRLSEAFVMIGQPDLAITTTDEGDIVVELRGFDTFNPRTGGVTSGKTGDVACWMIDTDHDGHSFFAQRIHFPGAEDDRQVKRLQKALGNGVDQLRWNAVFSTRSAPFPRPPSGSIAVKIITTTAIEMTVTKTIKTSDLVFRIQNDV